MKMLKLKNAGRLKRPFSFTFASDRSRSKNKDKDIVELEAEAKAEEEAADTVDAEQRAAFLIGQLELAEVPQNAHGLGTISVVVEEEEEDLEDEEDDDDVIAEVSPGSAGGGRDGSEPKASPATSSSKAPFTSRKRSRSFTVSRASRRSWSLLRNTFTGGSEQSADGRSSSSARSDGSTSPGGSSTTTTTATSATAPAARRSLGASRVGQRAASVDDVGGFRAAFKRESEQPSEGNGGSPGRRLLSLFQGALEQGSRGASLKRRSASAERSNSSSSGRGSPSVERGSSAERIARRQPAADAGAASSPQSDSSHHKSASSGGSCSLRASESSSSPSSPLSSSPQPSSSSLPLPSSEGNVAALVGRETEAQSAAAAAAAWREARREHEAELAALRARAAELEAQEEKRKEELRRLHESEQAAVSEVVYLKSENFELEKSVQLLKRSALRVVPPLNPARAAPASPTQASPRSSLAPSQNSPVTKPPVEAPAASPDGKDFQKAQHLPVVEASSNATTITSDAPSLRNLIAAALVAGLALTAGGAFNSKVPPRSESPAVASTATSATSSSSSSQSNRDTTLFEPPKSKSSSSSANSLSSGVSSADYSRSSSTSGAAVETDGVAAAANLLANFRNGIQAKTRETDTAGAAGGLGSKAGVEMHSGEWLESGDRSLSLFLGDDGRLRVLKGLPWADDSETLWQSPAPKDRGGQFVATREDNASSSSSSGGVDSSVGSLVVWQLKRFQKPKEVWRSRFDSSSSSDSSSDARKLESLALHPWLLPDDTSTFSSWTLRAVASAVVSGGQPLTSAGKAEALLKSLSAASAGRGARQEGNLVLDLKDSRARARALERLQLFTRAPANPS